MDRKVKIFSALASLSLAVVLIAFGVYAASRVSYTLGGSVSFVVSEPYGKIYLDSVQSGKLENGKKVYSSTVENLTYDNDNLVTSGEYGITAEGDETVRVEADLDLDKTFSEDLVAYKYTFKVSTLNEAEIAIKVTTGDEVPASDNIGEKVTLTKNEITNIDGEQTVTYYLFLLDLTKNATTINYSINIELNFATEITGGWSNPKDYEIEVPYSMLADDMKTKVDTLEDASYVMCGRYNGRPIIWDFYINDDNETMTLVSHYIIDERKVDNEGNNVYIGSDIQIFLTGDFYANSFNETEKSGIVEQDIDCSAEGNDSVIAQDQTVYLLTKEDVMGGLYGSNSTDSDSSRIKRKISNNEEWDYWLCTPGIEWYTNNISFSGRVNPNYTTGIGGVVPACTIRI